MSGHSKWHNIQAKKGKTDAARARVFTKLGKELMVAAKDNPNIDANSRLKDVVTKAKAANMPMDNIMRAIKKAAGELSGASYEEITYEGYGPGGPAFIVEALTDNKNRTAANVRHAFDKVGGNLGTPGSVSFQFNKKGQFILEVTDEIDLDELELAAIEAGAENIIRDEETVEILTEPEDYEAVSEALEQAGYAFAESGIKMVPNLYTEVDMETAVKIQKLIDILEEDDDVNDIYHNTDFPDEFEG
ncbi:YebC/PmpR family DNA-binding transcriptional regulator [Proteiniclasticum sp. QWL-01]|uniref:YebC/PmpR family DNA-binding transcriptional regulator n=1 Tax=Proteiniclasticum sp. QWL-01 TaxID=3036945 RepID=UPI0021FA6F99|nr:YebC/PmpR family DNA-binding transcriptional regulator [Proteiniclasticum sp. QWL-01]UUM12613.1 YebC/PmpR family DNA-binding transcriptional regulator [Clostridiaceae bacterium HFYG-1003]WFF74168.1 YebC/PmpR family DNA-binding transcriptional regulator [Proteiniclasticum sp. QWL-01]